jgi:hypothetical protein
VRISELGFRRKLSQEAKTWEPRLGFFPHPLWVLNRTEIGKPCRRELNAGVAQVRPLSDYDGTATIGSHEFVPISLGFHG